MPISQAKKKKKLKAELASIDRALQDSTASAVTVNSLLNKRHNLEARLEKIASGKQDGRPQKDVRFLERYRDHRNQGQIARWRIGGETIDFIIPGIALGVPLVSKRQARLLTQDAAQNMHELRKAYVKSAPAGDRVPIPHCERCGKHSNPLSIADDETLCQCPPVVPIAVPADEPRTEVEPVELEPPVQEPPATVADPQHVQEVKNKVLWLRNTLLNYHAAYAQGMGQNSGREYVALQRRFKTEAASLKKLSNSDYEEICSGYEHLFQIYDDPASSRLSEMMDTQIYLWNLRLEIQDNERAGRTRQRFDTVGDYKIIY